jgi:hypothetical protein
MIRYYKHAGNPLEITRCLRSIYEEPATQADPAAWGQVRTLLGIGQLTHREVLARGP